MNQFRDITICALVAFSLSLLLSQPQEWGWISHLGGYVVSGVQFMAQMRPWSVIVLMAVALALFMTRLKY